MRNKLSEAVFSSPELCLPLLKKLREELDAPLRFMEVCGTHTVSIFRSGLHSLLPEGITHLSGPGCPVCVTDDREISALLGLARRKEVVLATFGDLMRVPALIPGASGNSGTADHFGTSGHSGHFGPFDWVSSSLKQSQAQGARISVVYSPLEALNIATQFAGTDSDTQVVFAGIGFETTAPAVAAVIQMAAAARLKNFSVFSAHKLVPPALRLLLQEAESTTGGIDAFLLPGHVSTVLGLLPYNFVAEEFKRPGVVCGFEAADILQALLMLVRMRKGQKAEPGKPCKIVNQYIRAVDNSGNPKALNIMREVFMPADACWRGLGVIPESGLAVRDKYAAFDAYKKFDLYSEAASNGARDLDRPEIKGCCCGRILKGAMNPVDCPLFGTACTPEHPIGPCMVSSEGSCAASYKYV